MALKITGLAEIQKALGKAGANMDEAIDEAVRATAIKVLGNATMAIKAPSAGTWVTRYTTAGNPYDHIAAKEGESPNTVTGRLIGSIALDHQKGQGVAYVGTNLEYGFYLETVQNRPFLDPAMAAEKKNFDKRMESAINKQIKKARK